MKGCRVRIELKRFGALPVLRGISFEIRPGAFIALVGPSGAGKTTLLNIMGGLDQDFEGHLDWGTGGPGRIGYVFQEPRLMPWLSVRRNLELVMRDGLAVGDRIEHLLARVGLAGRSEALPGELSGGMQRRVSLARALAIEPDMLLLDEPFASLDEPTAENLRRLLLRLWQERQNAVLLVTHNLREALALADEVLFLSRDPARILHREELAPHAPDGGVLREADPLMANLLARHPEILSGIKTDGES